MKNCSCKHERKIHMEKFIETVVEISYYASLWFIWAGSPGWLIVSFSSERNEMEW